MKKLIDNIKLLFQIPPVFIDGFIYVLVQMLTVLSVQIGTDESAKYIEPKTLFWIKIVVGELAAGFLALKMYRSTQFAEHRREQDKVNGQKIGEIKDEKKTQPIS